MSGELFAEASDVELIDLDGSCPALRPCRYCGHDGSARLYGPVPPHGMGVRCTACGRALGWLPKSKTGHAEDDFDLIED